MISALKLRQQATLFWITALTTTALFGESYDYFPKAPMSLGSGFSRLRPTQKFPPCLDTSPSHVREASTLGAFQLNISLVRSRRDLYSLLHVDARLAARTLAANASVDTQFDKETSFESDDLIWVLEAYQEFGVRELLSVRANDDARQLLRTPQQLVARCGREYVQSERRAAQVAAVFSLHNLNESTKQTLQIHFSGGASWAGTQLDFSAGYKSFLLEASSKGRVDLRVYGFGGGGISKLSELVLKAENFASVQATLAKYIQEEVRPEKGYPISFNTGSFGSIANPPSSDVINDRPELESVYLAYGNALARLERIEEILRGRDRLFGYVSDSQAAQLLASRTKLAKAISALYQLSRQCSGDRPTCTFPEIDIEPISWPRNPEERCTDWRKGSCYACESAVSFSGYTSGRSLRLECSHMPTGVKIEIRFDGFIVVSSTVPDNKVWNSWIIAGIGGVDGTCVADNRDWSCMDSRVSEGLGAPNVPQNLVKLNRYWKRFRLGGVQTMKGAESTATLVIHKCQNGPSEATCDTVPPGTGTDFTGDGVLNRGFPEQYPPESAIYRIRVIEP